jgi:hypothetical protein
VGVPTSGDGPRTAQPSSSRYPDPPPPAPPPAPPILDDLEDDNDSDGEEAEMVPAALAYAFTAAAHSLGISESHSVSKALKGAQSLEWKEAIDKELNSLWNMGTFTIVDALLPGWKAIGLCLVFKFK